MRVVLQEMQQLMVLLLMLLSMLLTHMVQQTQNFFIGIVLMLRVLMVQQQVIKVQDIDMTQAKLH